MYTLQTHGIVLSLYGHKYSAQNVNFHKLELTFFCISDSFLTVISTTSK
jgi:hypothetical protein